MIETQDEGGKIGTRVRESYCTVARVYSSYEKRRQGGLLRDEEEDARGKRRR